MSLGPCIHMGDPNEDPGMWDSHPNQCLKPLDQMLTPTRVFESKFPTNVLKYHLTYFFGSFIFSFPSFISLSIFKICILFHDMVL